MGLEIGLMKYYFIYCYSIIFFVGEVFLNSHWKYFNRSIMTKRNLSWLQRSCRLSTLSFKNEETSVNIIHNSKPRKLLFSCISFLSLYYHICSTAKSQMGFSPPKKSQMPSLYLPTGTFLEAENQSVYIQWKHPTDPSNKLLQHC